ncbi:hypothetical protein EC973_003576 [Apophysomyces ossiformis]|uniref:Uncharacterized protein n=1 Tax=Apophysomyces ossiformis TaxID=679940 RepID=A0A8H7BT99_9FUNG|nr:hypothetical protein EC973_003576 [Apophysomyces ossiformis]
MTNLRAIATEHLDVGLEFTNAGNFRRMNYQTIETFDVKKEQEFWNEVIDRATQNLIDISSSNADPLQSQDIQERVEKYRDLLEQMDTDNQQRPPVQLLQNNLSAVDVLMTAKPYGGMKEDEVEWFCEAMDNIQIAIQQIQVQPVGDMVVHLTMTENSLIRAY